MFSTGYGREALFSCLDCHRHPSVTLIRVSPARHPMPSSTQRTVEVFNNVGGLQMASQTAFNLEPVERQGFFHAFIETTSGLSMVRLQGSL